MASLTLFSSSVEYSDIVVLLIENRSLREAHLPNLPDSWCLGPLNTWTPGLLVPWCLGLFEPVDEVLHYSDDRKT